MQRRATRWAFVGLIVALLGCAPTVATTRGVDTSGAPGPAVKKSINVAMINTDPVIIRYRANVPGKQKSQAGGVDALEQMLHAGAATANDQGGWLPQLAEAVPSVENGLWKLSPDGRMETTWRIKSNAVWHDGTPVTAEDLVFTVRVSRDREMVELGTHSGFSVIDGAQAVDPRTVTVSWKTPFIDADQLFTLQFAMPMPAHLLESTYREDKSRVLELPHWNQEFVGAGPFRLKDWVLGSHMVLEAFDQYVLGRPKLDEIVVKFIPDDNTVVANLLAGAVDITVGRGLSLEQGIQARDSGRDVRMPVAVLNWLVIFPQFINPDPPIVGGDKRFRKALMHAMDRQEMTDTFQSGLAPVAHSIVNIHLPQYRELESYVVRYDFDPRRAGQLLEELGYVRQGDGFFADRAGQRLKVQIRTTGVGQDIQLKSMFAIADYWKKAGVDVDTAVIPQAREADREYRATRPGFEVLRRPDGVAGLDRDHSSNTALPENDFRPAGNGPRYMNAEYDALLEQLFVTIPMRERFQVLGEVLRHSTDVVVNMGTFHIAEPAVITNSRLVNAGPRSNPIASNAWNVYEWELK